MKKVIVTGGLGYIGSHTCLELQDAGYHPIVIDNVSTGNAKVRKILNEHGPATIYFRDMEDDKWYEWLYIDGLSKDIVGAIHFAANAYVRESVIDPLKYYNNNVVNGISFINMLMNMNVKNIVFSSSCATFGTHYEPITPNHQQNPINPYGRTKLVFEWFLQDLLNAGQIDSFAALRYFNVAGAHPDGILGEDHDPETHILPNIIDTALGRRDKFILNGTDVDTPDGTHIRDYIHVTDLAKAHVKALELLLNKQTNEIRVNLGAGNGYSNMQLINKVQEVSGCKINYDVNPSNPADPPSLVADNTLARELLGWEPKLSDIDTIVRTAYQWRVNNPNGYER